jgi:hypothetical protein
VSFLLTSTNQVFAQSVCASEMEKFTIVTVNGVLTTLEGAADNRDALIDALGRSYQSQQIRYDMAFNFPYGAITNVLQQARGQLQASRGSLGPVASAAEEAVLSLNINSLPAAPDLNAQVQAYRQSLLAGKKTLLVAHSQGSFYANLADTTLAAIQPALPMQSFGIYAVAVPAAKVDDAAPDLSNYITNDRDFVRRVPGSLPSNWIVRKADGTAADDLNEIDAHSFTDAYLSPRFNMRAELIGRLKNKLGSLQEAPVAIGSGAPGAC